MPQSLDYVDLRPDLVADMVLRHRDLASTLPLQKWWKNPISAVFTVKGCSHDCVTCGASRTTCTGLTKRSRPAFRSPASLVENMTAIGRISRAPIYLVGDVLQAGADAAHEFLERLQRARLRNEIVFEFLDLPPASFLRDIDCHVERWSMELSPDSHDPALRQAQDGEPPYSNGEMEAVFAEALRLDCRRIDVFFMIGLPGRPASPSCRRSITASDCSSWTTHAWRASSRRWGRSSIPEVAASRNRSAFGYRLFARTLEEHRQLLVQPTWERNLNYETLWMTRRQLVDATYDAAERLNELKGRYGRIPPREARAIARRITEARVLRARLERESGGKDSAASGELAGEINRYSMSTVCDKRELFWPRHLVNFRLSGLARLLVNYATR